MFYTLTNLQGSQTPEDPKHDYHKFYTLTNLQGSQTSVFAYTYFSSFTLLQTYKVLKPIVAEMPQEAVLHSYKLTRFSNLK